MFEQPLNLKVLFDFFWAWFYLRFFMRTRVNEMGPIEHQYQVGDLSPNFALASFFPKRIRMPVAKVADVSYALLNMCGLVNAVRSCLQKRAGLLKEQPVKKKEK